MNFDWNQDDPASFASDLEGLFHNLFSMEPFVCDEKDRLHELLGKIDPNTEDIMLDIRKIINDPKARLCASLVRVDDLNRKITNYLSEECNYESERKCRNASYRRHCMATIYNALEKYKFIQRIYNAGREVALQELEDNYQN